MAAFMRRFHVVLRDFPVNPYYRGLGRFSTDPNQPQPLANSNENASTNAQQKSEETSPISSENSVELKKTYPPKQMLAPAEYRFIFPEFLPDRGPDIRHSIREKLERMDMLKRRRVIDIPEFYVGSIIAVTASDRCAPGKHNRFLGICIHRSGHGLRATMVVRNIIDHQGVEIMYELYNPTIQQIDVIRLEKRLDNELFYLRDALPEYSTFPFDMVPVPHPDGAAVPVNPIKVKLKARPWHERWHRKDLKGVQDFELPERFYKRARELATPWEKYDLMKEYRRLIPEEDQQEIYADVHEEQKKSELVHKKAKKNIMRSSILQRTQK